MDDAALRNLATRVEQTRRAVVMAPPHSVVTVEREAWLELAELTLACASRLAGGHSTVAQSSTT